jgi:hypothetical protein
MSKKLTQEYIESYFQSFDCTLLTEYKSARSPLKYICPNGHTVEIIWNSFQNGTRCPSCCKNKKFTQKEVEDYFEQEGCKLLDNYINSKTPVKYLCKCGNESKIRFAMFRYGNRCRSCGLEKYSGENHGRWNPDRKAVELNKKISEKAHRALRTTMQCLGKRKNSATAKLLGYTNKELKEHLETFDCWNDIKDKSWSLDHKYPIKAFIDYKETDISIINCLDNIQPMLLSDNCSKNDSYNKEEFEHWLKEKR